MQQLESTPRQADAGRIAAFEYPAGPDAPSFPGWYGSAEDSGIAGSSVEAAQAGGGSVDPQQQAAFEKRLAEEKRLAYEAGCKQGRESECEAQAAARAASERERAQQAAKLIESFTAERERYMQDVEREVARLALAVAARILRREAQMDPLLLTGAVRVALGQLSDSTQVRLRVPAADLSLWKEAMALMPNLAVRPEVMAGEGMHLGDCRIETELGSVDLGLRAQLGEIERSFSGRDGAAANRESNAEAPSVVASTGQESHA